MKNIKSKLECLFGYHKFDESWKHPALNMYFKICVNCRRYVQFPPTIYEITHETPQYLYLRIGMGVYKYQKNENKTLSFTKMASWEDTYK